MSTLNNDREIFEVVKKHLLTQMKVARHRPSSPVCAYRSYDGLKCAVGCLITDEAYDPNFEGIGIDEAVVYALDESGVVFHKNTVALLENLQHTHDNVPVEEWASSLEAFRFDDDNNYINHLYDEDEDSEYEDEDGEECPSH